MSIILLINTFENSQSIALAKDSEVLQVAGSDNNKEFKLHSAIINLLSLAEMDISALDAIAVISGPGSYTGLRVGMAAAKGLCFSLKKPLITLNSLEVIAKSSILQNRNPEAELFCPMIDARRDEVFTAIYDKNLSIILSPCAKILVPESFGEMMENKEILFSGSGAEKWSRISSKSIRHETSQSDINQSFILLAFEKFITGNTAPLIATEPNYLKDFHQSV